ncbi:MAG: hypothetical protein LBD41_02550 [Clostridiales Family XIII bacterium]|jgi:hypothetical protein|nr:hypothetical protein [Clostridiales Family XIII bacterium]
MKTKKLSPEEKDIISAYNHFIIRYYNNKKALEKEFWEYCIRIGFSGSFEDALKIVEKNI